MRIAFTFRNIESTEPLKNYATDKLKKLEKYVKAPLDLEVTYTVEHQSHRIDVNLSAAGESHVAHDESGDMYASIDLVVDKLRKQLIRHKGAARERRRSAPGTLPAESE